MNLESVFSEFMLAPTVKLRGMPGSCPVASPRKKNNGKIGIVSLLSLSGLTQEVFIASLIVLQ
jgi:hypothetical protein